MDFYDELLILCKIPKLLTEDVQEALYLKLGEEIKYARLKSNIKQELLAEYLDLSRVSISNIENGKQRIQLHTLLELAKYLKVDIALLLEPLNSLIINFVTPSEERKIIKGAEFPKSSETESDKDFEKPNPERIREFINFLRVKKS